MPVGGSCQCNGCVSTGGRGSAAVYCTVLATPLSGPAVPMNGRGACALEDSAEDDIAEAHSACLPAAGAGQGISPLMTLALSSSDDTPASVGYAVFIARISPAESLARAASSSKVFR